MTDTAKRGDTGKSEIYYLRSAAEQTLADAANITHWEISRIFRSVDAVHTLVVHSVVPYVPKRARSE